jgi:hypothetical protein
MKYLPHLPPNTMIPDFPARWGGKNLPPVNQR